ncbi:alpha,alpha-trehalase TreF [Halobium salinum]|uniref:Alpha,alpha-trehalase TreF n=1 Tax=Halobium salinum TaxID=1364940 RepID=A0ABD5PHX9_9EURY|nr:alpha,alpha-trehalase TreF [Halobium salinum]
MPYLSYLEDALFEAVQRHDVFEDSKTFVDSVPAEDPETISERFESVRTDEVPAVESFVSNNFRVSGDDESVTVPDAGSMEEHVRKLWPALVEHPTATDPEVERGTLLALPHPYVTPGGRFRELYYWDSYFTAEGLAASDRFDLVEAFADNLAWCVDRFGFVPNGNREYFTTRSQPPTFAALVDIVARERGVSAVEEYLPALEREHAFWMDGAASVDAAVETASETTAAQRAVTLPGGTLNRYWDDAAIPRQESFREDIDLAERATDRDPKRLYRDVRAACESGWDFSTRWCWGEGLETVHTTDLVPVDLNAALYGLESSLATWHRALGNTSKADRFDAAATRRRELLDRHCWDDDAGWYFDYDFRAGEHTSTWSLAAAAPLFFGAASDAQAAHVASHIRQKFLEPGGLVTTLVESGEQWDAPNGWAPLQWFGAVGLERYGHDALAREVATRWVDHVRSVYRRTGKLVEKYDVRGDGRGGGGEYPLQDGFGWTNGVTLALGDRFDLGVDDEATRTVGDGGRRGRGGESRSQ